MSRNKETELNNNYHPDSVKYMLEKHGNGITREQAEAADQEWASTRAQEFARGLSRGDSQSVEAIMQEPPLGAGIPSKRTHLKSVHLQTQDQLAAADQRAHH